MQSPFNGQLFADVNVTHHDVWREISKNPLAYLSMKYCWSNTSAQWKRLASTVMMFPSGSTRLITSALRHDRREEDYALETEDGQCASLLCAIVRDTPKCPLGFLTRQGQISPTCNVHGGRVRRHRQELHEAFTVGTVCSTPSKGSNTTPVVRPEEYEDQNRESQQKVADMKETQGGDTSRNRLRKSHEVLCEPPATSDTMLDPRRKYERDRSKLKRNEVPVQFLGWCPPVLGPVARQSLGWSPLRGARSWNKTVAPAFYNAAGTSTGNHGPNIHTMPL